MMTPEIWVAIGAVFLGLAIVAGGLAMSAVRGPWDAVAIGARVAALVALIVAMIASAIGQDQWTAAAPQQAMLSLVVAMLAVHLVLAWRLGACSAGPMVDLVALVLGLVGVFAIEAGAPGLGCVQQSSLFQAHLVLFSLGGGSVLVAGSAGLMLALKKGLVWLGRDLRLPGWIPLYALLTQATLLAVVALGAGLIIGVWWAWQTVGLLAAGNPRDAWMAVAWLTTAMSLVAWQLDGRRGRWAAGLALVAAAAVFVGLLFPVDLSLVGI
jgi:hypothetical protein